MGNNEKFDPGELPGNRSCVLNNEYGDTEVLLVMTDFPGPEKINSISLQEVIRQNT